MQTGTGLRAKLFYNNHSAENQILPQYYMGLQINSHPLFKGP